MRVGQCNGGCEVFLSRQQCMTSVFETAYLEGVQVIAVLRDMDFAGHCTDEILHTGGHVVCDRKGKCTAMSKDDTILVCMDDEKVMMRGE